MRSVGSPSGSPAQLLAFAWHVRLGRFLGGSTGGRLIQPALIVLVLLPIAFAGIYGYRSTEREATDAVLAKREHISYLVAAILTEKLDRLVDIGVALATRLQFRRLIENGEWNRAMQILASVPSTLPFVDRLFLADADGVLVADAPALDGVRGQSFAHRDWYQGAVRTGTPYVSEIYERSASPRLNVVAVAVPIHAASGSLNAILVMQIRLETFFDWFKDAPAGSDWRIYIVDRHGQTAFHADYTPQGATLNLAREPGVSQALAGRRGVEVVYDETLGEDRILAYTPVARYGWGVVVAQPARTAFAERDAALRRYLIVYALLLLLGGCVAALFARAREQARHKADLQRLVAARTAELEAANKELEAFSYSVSHDLRAPLRSVDGFSRVLYEECRDRLDPKHSDYLMRVRAATQRMSKLIDDLLMLSRITRAEMHRSAVDLSALAHAAVAELRSGQPGREVAVTIQSGMTVTGDAALLRVMLDNLLGNAWKFTGKTAGARVEFGATTGDNGTRIYYIRDNGAGFDMAYAAKLFGAFQRLHSADEFPGTGIGLATVQRIVRRHGGRIWAEGAVGRGATFYFTLDNT